MKHFTGGLAVETEKFKAALHRYMNMTSKSVEKALNGKMRDLLFKAAEFAPIGQPRNMILAGIDNKRAVAVWRRRRQHGFPPFSPKKDQPFSAADVDYTMNRIGLGRGYLRSAFYKAAQKFPITDATALGRLRGGSGKFSMSRAETSTATLTAQVSKAWMFWKHGSPEDEAQRTPMLESAVAAALAWVRLDMEMYFKRKMAEHAREVSAKR